MDKKCKNQHALVGWSDSFAFIYKLCQFFLQIIADLLQKKKKTGKQEDLEKKSKRLETMYISCEVSHNENDN